MYCVPNTVGVWSQYSQVWKSERNSSVQVRSPPRQPPVPFLLSSGMAVGIEFE